MSKHFCVARTQQTTVGHCLLLYYSDYAQLRFVFLNFPFVFLNFLSCVKTFLRVYNSTNYGWLLSIVILFSLYSASLRTSKFSFRVSKHCWVSRTQQTTVGYCLLLYYSVYTHFRFVFLNFPCLCQNIFACLELNKPRLAIVYCYIIQFILSFASYF